MDKSVLDKLNIYDVLGYFIPGAIALLALEYLYKILKFPLPFQLQNTVQDSFIFFILSFFFGILMHELSQIIEKHILIKDWKGMPSQRALTEDGDLFKQEEKQQYYEVAEEAFDINIGSESQYCSDLIFNRFRLALKQANLDQNAEIFNAQYGLARNLLASSLVGYCIFYFLMIHQACVKGTSGFYIINTLLFLGATLLLNRRIKRFGETFVKTIFRNYYECYRVTKIRQKVPALT